MATSTARAGGHGIDGAERAFLDAGADDRRGQPDQLLDVGGDDGLGVGRQRPIGGEQLRVVSGAAALDGDQGVEQPPQPLRRRPRSAAIARSGGMVASTHRPTTRSRSSALVATCR